MLIQLSTLGGNTPRVESCYSSFFKSLRQSPERHGVDSPIALVTRGTAGSDFEINSGIWSQTSSSTCKLGRPP